MHSAVIIIFSLISGEIIFCQDNFDRRSLGRAINQFGDNLYRTLSEQKGNIIFSPLSIHSSLSLLSLGAGGKTYKELLSNLFIADVEDLRNGYLEEANTTGCRKNLDQPFHVANNIYVDKNLHLRDNFKTLARNIFAASPQNVDFKEPKEASEVINKWIADHTDRKITNIVDEKFLDHQTVVLLLNAIYFKGKWKLKFDKSKTTRNYVFHAPEADVECSMMTMARQRHKYWLYPSYGMLELDFEDSNIRMVFVRPKINITEVEHILNDEMLFKSIKELKPRSVEVQIPKFKLKSQFSLKKPLISIGLSSIFHNPDLSNLLKEKIPTRVSEVLQKTLIEVNEDGATATAATGVFIEARSARYKTFVLNKPFLFFLYDYTNEVVLMRGRIENPAID